MDLATLVGCGVQPDDRFISSRQAGRKMEGRCTICRGAGVTSGLASYD